MTKAEFHPEFIRFVLKHHAEEAVPDLSAWPHSEADFLRVRGKIREVMVELKRAPGEGGPPVDR